MNIFEVAVREKFRFPYKGLVGVEDLWDIPVTELDKVYKELNKAKKTSQEESLLEKKNPQDEIINIKIDIIKHIVAVKQQEAADRLEASEKRKRKQRILEVMARKEDEELEGKSLEDLQKELEELN